jgi:polyisoprenyl-teichoic acid--peptidoglycan teichoic acid transferase
MMKKILRTLSVLLLFSVTACAIGPAAPEPVAPLVTLTPTATGTSTPTPTLSPTPAPTLTPRPTRTPTVTPTPRVVPRGRVTILVLGSDQRPGSSFRTDVMVLLTVDTRKRTVTAVSFPRDLYLEIPGWKEERLNTAFPHGGFELLAETFEVNFGLRPDFYIMTNMQGFVDIVDNLGGVTVSVGSTLKDECPWATPISDKGTCTVEAGLTEMEGATALWYIRSRKTSSDFDRLRRAQEVLLGIFYKSMRQNPASRLPDLYNAYKKNVQTNMSTTDMARLMSTAGRVVGDQERISRYAISSKDVKSTRTESGMAVLLPDYERIDEILNQAVFAP